MAASLQDIKKPKSSGAPGFIYDLDPNAALRIRAEEAHRFIDTDPDSQAFLQRQGLVHGTDSLGWFLDANGERTNKNIAYGFVGNSPGALASEQRAQERIAQLSAPQALPQASTAVHPETGLENPEEELFGPTMGSSMQSEYRTEAERKPWVEAPVFLESGAAAEESAAGEPVTPRRIADVGPPQTEIPPQVAAPEGRAPSRFGQALAVEGGLKRVSSFSNALKRTYGDVASTYSKVRGNHNHELTAVNIAAAKRIKPPSTIRYALFIGLSVFVDGTISPLVTAAYATLILGILATAVLGIFMALAGRLLLGSHGKEALRNRKELEQKSTDLRRDIKVVQQEYHQFLRWLQTAAQQFPKVAARATSAAAKAGRLAGKYNLVKWAGKLVNWLKKGWVKQSSEAVPMWNLLPWWTIGAVCAYLSHRGDYREAQELLTNYNEGKVGVLGMTDTMYQTRLGVIEDIHVELVTSQTDDGALPAPSPAV